MLLVPSGCVPRAAGTLACRARSRSRLSASGSRRRGRTVGEFGQTEPLRPLPPSALPAEIVIERVASRSVLVAFEGNRWVSLCTPVAALVRARVASRSCALARHARASRPGRLHRPAAHVGSRPRDPYRRGRPRQSNPPLPRRPRALAALLWRDARPRRLSRVGRRSTPRRRVLRGRGTPRGLGIFRRAAIGRRPAAASGPQRAARVATARRRRCSDRGGAEGKPWGLIEMVARDPDGLAIFIVEVPPHHPQRRAA
jgi:hypothetical protein